MQNYVEERDGGYYIAGTCISLDSIVHAFQAGESPDEILRSFPIAGPVVRIYGAITFYLENKEKVEDYLKNQERRWDWLRREWRLEVRVLTTEVAEHVAAVARQLPIVPLLSECLFLTRQR